MPLQIGLQYTISQLLLDQLIVSWVNRQLYFGSKWNHSKIMLRYTVCDWTNRFEEIKDLGFDGLRLNIPEIDNLFPNKPVFKSAETRRYLYEVDWAATTGGVNKFETVVWAQGNHTMKELLLAAKAQNFHIVILFAFNGFGGNWSTPNIEPAFANHTVTASSGASLGATSVTVTTTTGAIPAGAVMTFVRGGSGYVMRAYVSANASSGATSLSVYHLSTDVSASDVIAVIRAGAYIGTVTASAFGAMTDPSDNRTITVSATGFNINANDCLMIFRGGTIITTTTCTTRRAAGVTTVPVSALPAAINSGDFCNVADVPTLSEPYTYRCPDPADAQANTDAALAIMAYILDDPDILYPRELVQMEEWNEPDQRVFGGQGFPGTSTSGYGYGWGFFSYPVKYLLSVRAPQVRAAFPDIPFLTPSFTFGGDTSACSMRSENVITSGLAQSDGIDAYWQDFTLLNTHSYVSSIDGSKRGHAYALFREQERILENAASFSNLASLPRIMTENGVRPLMFTAVNAPNNDRFNGEMLLVGHDACRAMGFVGWGQYCYHYRSTEFRITATGSHSIGATTINLSAATGIAIPAGAVLYFGTQGAKATLTANASSAATSLSVSAITTAINNNDKSWYVDRSSQQFFHMVPDMTTRNSLFIGVDNPYGKNDMFWVFAERFARVELPDSPEPIPNY